MWNYIDEVCQYSRIIMDYLLLEDSWCGSQSINYNHYGINVENTTRNSHLKLWVKISFHSCFLKPHLDAIIMCFHRVRACSYSQEISAKAFGGKMPALHMDIER